MKISRCSLLLIFVLALSGCTRAATKNPIQLTSVPTVASPVSTPTETPSPSQTAAPAMERLVELLPLSGAISAANAEISGMAWFAAGAASEMLILLPQYPERFKAGGEADGAVLAIPKTDILAFLDSERGEAQAAEFNAAIRLVPFYAPGLKMAIPGFEGFEAIAFSGGQVFLTIEASAGNMKGYLISGTMAQDLSALRVEVASVVEIPQQVQIANFSDETLLVAGQRLVTLYEANGAGVNPSPAAHLFDFNLQMQAPVPFPAVEYRLTDATSPDETGRFWAINYFFTGDVKIKPESDPIAVRDGEGASHAQYDTVERLLQFQFTEAGIVLTDTPSIQLQLIDDDHARNWEAIARLAQRGFLLATDKFPGTLLAFVAYP